MSSVPSPPFGDRRHTVQQIEAYHQQVGVGKKVRTTKQRIIRRTADGNEVEEFSNESTQSEAGVATESVFGSNGEMITRRLVFDPTNHQPSNGTLAIGDVESSDSNSEQRLNDSDLDKILKKTTNNFMAMLEEQKSAFIDKFPALKNLKQQEGSFLPSETTTEYLPDGTIRTIRTERKHLRSSIKTLVTVGENGEIITKTVKTRAILEYQGPGGGYKMKLVSDDDNDQISEDEEDDESKSLSPSELRDDESAVVQYSKGYGGSRIPQLKAKPQGSVESLYEKKLGRAWCAAKELVDTEESYVQKLHLLEEIFRKRITEANCLQKEKCQRIFANVQSLYMLHNKWLLPALLERLRDWQGNQKISDVITSKAAYFKLYSEYTNNYKRATKAYDECMKKNKKFSSVVHEIEKMPECNSLPLVSHLICPVQRVMRYHLLLQEYLKNLPENHQDKADTQVALDLVLKAAHHANEMMKKLDRYKDVMRIQELLGGQISELVTPSRELVREGQLSKISARNDEIHELRQVYLFNDMMLLCSTPKFSLNKCKLRAAIEIYGMQICEGDRLDIENTFYIRTAHRKLELYTKTAEEKKHWIDCFQSAIRDYTARVESFQPSANNDLSRTPSPQPPVAASVSDKKCKGCSATFGTFRKEKMCSTCGTVLCSKCCSFKPNSENLKCRENKICRGCFERLSSPSSPASGEENNSGKINPGVLTDLGANRKSILMVKPDDENAVYSDDMELRSSYRRQWIKRYFSVHKDFVLYSFKFRGDSSAQSALPLPGCEVGFLDGKEIPDDASRNCIFKVTHHTRTYYLKVPSENDMAKRRPDRVWLLERFTVYRTPKLQNVPTTAHSHRDPPKFHFEVDCKCCLGCGWQYWNLHPKQKFLTMVPLDNDFIRIMKNFLLIHS